MQRNSVDQYILMPDLANTDTAKVIQPQVKDVQVKEPQSLKYFQIIVKIKNCLEEKYNDHQFPFFLFFFEVTAYLYQNIKNKEGERRERGKAEGSTR